MNDSMECFYFDIYCYFHLLDWATSMETGISLKEEKDLIKICFFDPNTDYVRITYEICKKTAKMEFFGVEE